MVDSVLVPVDPPKAFYDTRLAEARAALQAGDLPQAREIAALLAGLPAEPLGPLTMAGVPRRLHALLLRIAKAEGDVAAKAGWQVTQVPPPGVLAPFVALDEAQTARALALATVPVPRVLHQVWIGPLAPPANLDAWRAQAQASGWGHRLWREADIETLWTAAADRGAEAAYREMLTRGDYPGAVDVARYALLQAEGGVYLDADCWPVGPGLEAYVPVTGLIAAAEPVPRVTGAGAAMFENAVIGCPPGHPAMTALLRAVPAAMAAIRRAPAWWVTGPLLFTLAARQGPVTLLPDRFWGPRLRAGAGLSERDRAVAEARARGSFTITWKSW